MTIRGPSLVVVKWRVIVARADDDRDALFNPATLEVLYDGKSIGDVLNLPLTEATEQPHNKARGTYVEHHGLVQPAPAPRFSATPAALTTPPSRTGADTREALAAWGVDDVETLIADGVAVQKD